MICLPNDITIKPDTIGLRRLLIGSGSFSTVISLAKHTDCRVRQIDGDFNESLEQAEANNKQVTHATKCKRADWADR